MRIDCPSRSATSCKITFKGWHADDVIGGWVNGVYVPSSRKVGSHVYRTYVWADLKQDPRSSVTCATDSMLVHTRANKSHTDLDDTTRELTYDSMSFRTPSNLPGGCVLEKWAAAVHIEKSATKVGGSRVFFFGRSITGSSLADTLTGDAGRNLIVGRGGDDTLSGNGGIDTFGYLPALPDIGVINRNGSDTITDYHLGATKAVSDIIHICRGTAEDAPTWSGANSGSDHVITVSQGSDTIAVITLQGITTASANFANLNVVIDNSLSYCG